MHRDFGSSDLAEETKKAVKVLSTCQQQQENWIEAGELGNLSIKFRMMSEPLVTVRSDEEG